MKPMNEQGNTNDCLHWENLIGPRLKAFMALALYMGFKVQPNYKTLDA